MSTDKRIVISLDELEKHVGDCADGCDDGFEQVIEVCKDEFEKEHGVNKYAIAVASEEFKKSIFDMLMYSHDELISDEDSCWFEFSLSDVDDLFTELPLISDAFDPDLDEPEPQLRKFTPRAMPHEISGRFARGNQSPGTW